MNNTQKIALNTVIQLIGKAVTVATSVLVIAYITRYLGVAGYGEYATIFAYLGLFGSILDLGFFVIVVREIVKKPEAERTILGNMLGLKLCFGLLIFGLAYMLTRLIPYPEVVRQGILIGAISQLFISLNQAPLGSFQASLTMYKATFSDVLGRLLLLGLVWSLIHQSGGLISVVWAVVWTNMIVFGLNIIMMSHKYWLVPLFDWREWQKLFAAALPMGIVMILGVIYFRIDVLILGYLQGSYAVGIYSAPYKILEVLLAIPAIFMSSVLPVITTALRDAPLRAKQIFQSAFNFLSLLALPLIAGSLAIATPVMVLISGSDYVASGQVLQILIFSLAGSFLNSVMIYTIIAANQQHRLIRPYVWAVLFNIAANLLIIPKFSFLGAAAVTVLTEMGVLIFSAYLVAKYLKLSADWRMFGKILLVSVVMGCVLWWSRETLPLIGLIGLGTSVYAGLIVLMRIVTWAEITSLIPQLQKK